MIAPIATCPPVPLPRECLISGCTCSWPLSATAATTDCDSRPHVRRTRTLKRPIGARSARPQRGHLSPPISANFRHFFFGVLAPSVIATGLVVLHSAFFVLVLGSVPDCPAEFGCISKDPVPDRRAVSNRLSTRGFPGAQEYLPLLTGPSVPLLQFDGIDLLTGYLCIWSRAPFSVFRPTLFVASALIWSTCRPSPRTMLATAPK